MRCILCLSTLFLSGCDTSQSVFKPISGTETSAEIPETTEKTTAQIREANATNSELKEWELRFSARNVAWGAKHRGARFGVVEAREDARARSLEAFENAAALVDIVFHENSRPLSTLFLSDEDENRTWTFSVKSSDPHARIELEWSLYKLTPAYDAENRKRYAPSYVSSHPLLQRLVLVDRETGENVALGTHHTYRFDMNGTTERTFIWKLNDTPVILSRHLKPDRYRTPKAIVTPRPAFDINNPPFSKGNP